MIRCASPPDNVVADWPKVRYPKPKIVQHLDLFPHHAIAREKTRTFLDRHIQHIANALSSNRDVQRLAIEARTFACRADHLYIRHEIKLRGDHTFTLALLAASSLDVEAEASGFVAAFNRQRRLREQVANIVVETDIGGRIERLFRPIGD